MRSDFIIPRPTPAVVTWLRTQTDLAAIHSGRVSTELNQTMPCMRVNVVYYLPTADRWERVPVFQIESWAANERDADVLGTLAANVWPDFRGNVGQAYISGAWLNTDGPIPVRDPNTQFYRTFFDGALRIHAGGL
jgi:hypothetical protein